MLRIHIINEQPGATSLYVEGRLAGDGVDELRRVWASLRESSPNTQTIVDLSSVRAVDNAGRKLLCDMHACGTRLAGSGLCIGPLIEEIVSGEPCPDTDCNFI